MTTIIANKCSMAADGRGCSNEIIAGDSGVKVIRLQDGSLLGTSGPTFALELMREWLDGDCVEEFPKDAGEFGALHLTISGEIRLYTDASKRSWRQVDPPAAIGSGRELAMGAVLAGATLLEAVRIASLRDPFTGGKFMQLELQDVP
jgi:hypothetical protein